MRTSTVRRVCLSVMAAAALTSVAACGGSDSGKSADRGTDKAGGVVKADPIAALRNVQKKTGGERSAKVEGTTQMGTMMSMKQTGVIDWSDGLTGSMEITYTGGSMADAVKQSGGDGTMQARYFKDGYVVNMGDGFAAQAGGKHWISYRYADLAKMAGASGEAMKQQMQNTTPDQGVKSLLASGDVQKVGTEDVRGVQATHYSGTVDVASLTAKNSALDAGQLEQLKKQFSDAGITTEQVDIWVDANDLLVKKVERGQMKTGELNSTVYYSDYGTKASVEQPPAADTVDFAELLKQQQGAGGAAS
ncbi:hypothetical protein ACFCV8_03810 [Streptomyces sp. NPDC056347]|uniref:hypothetical protein n=1 Tax=Streptomyces sp. NPDC056347 TaxID=3345790 RepID=UPI0035DA3AD7